MPQENYIMLRYVYNNISFTLLSERTVRTSVQSRSCGFTLVSGSIIRAIVERAALKVKGHTRRSALKVKGADIIR